MLRMCNVKIEYKKFVSHKNEFFLWHVITFLLLRDNRNISSWHSILNNVQKKKKFVLHEKQFCVETKGFMCTESNAVSAKSSWCCTKKCFTSTKKVTVAFKKIIHVDKNKMKKKYYALKKVINFFPKGPS